MKNITVILGASQVEGFKTKGDLLNKAGISVDVIIVPDDRLDEAMGLIKGYSDQELEKAFERVVNVNPDEINESRGC